MNSVNKKPTCEMCGKHRPTYQCSVYDFTWQPGKQMWLCDWCICLMRDMRKYVTVEKDEEGRN